MTNYWLQVNFRGTPESSVVWRFKLAMWKVSGIKIESAAGRQKFLPKWNGTLWKMENFRKSVRRRKFSMWKFFRDSTMLKLSSRGFRKCGTFWACELLKWSYCCSKSDDVGRTRVASKIRWRNSALQTLYPPLPYIFWKLGTCSFTWYHPIYVIPIEKIE